MLGEAQRVVYTPEGQMRAADITRKIRDLEEGLRAASAVGDDTIQKRTQGHIVPDAFTHGTAEQRVKWFRTGFASGDPRSCNTFAAKDS